MGIVGRPLIFTPVTTSLDSPAHQGGLLREAPTASPQVALERLAALRPNLSAQRAAAGAGVGRFLPQSPVRLANPEDPNDGSAVNGGTGKTTPFFNLSSPHNNVRTLMDAAKRGDLETVKTCCTESGLANLGDNDTEIRETLQKMIDGDFKLGDLKDPGTESVGYYYIVNGKQSEGYLDITFEKIGDQWLVVDID